VVIALAVSGEQPMGKVDHAGDVGNCADRRPWRDASEEADLVLEHVARARQIALVEQRFRDGPGGVGCQPAHGFPGVPVRSEQVRPEVAHDRHLLHGGQ
jgi:hypothetical protein